ncbi:MAG: NAD-dependent epimerase/dehydratase family protein, partial [Polyangiales bacterium]
ASIVALGRPPVGEVGDESTPYEGWDVDFPYGRTKFLSRWIAQDFANWGLDVRIVCPGMVFGPGDVAPTPSGQLIINAVKGGPPIYTDGGASYVDVRDAAEVHVLADEKGKAGEVYLATAHNLHVNELQQAIDRVLGRSRKYRRLPVPLARAAVTAMERQAQKKGQEPPIPRIFFEFSLKPSFYSNEKSKRELGATYRPLDQTIREAIDWFRQRGDVR